jgi:hypothetical protein
MSRLIIAAAFAIVATAANATQLLVLNFSPDVRIVLSKEKCFVEGEPGYVAVAQRIDKAYMRGCWTSEPHEKLVRIQWIFDKKYRDDPDSFSVFDRDDFYPVQLDSGKVKGEF